MGDMETKRSDGKMKRSDWRRIEVMGDEEE
jgi:hypothetical protein